MSLQAPAVAKSWSLNDLPDIILGAGVFNYQYHTDPNSLPAKDVLKRAFEKGIRAFDTSAYYGPSEEIVGRALEQLKPEFARESYFICTKAGRNGVDDFDYSAKAIRKSVLRSLDRLGTDYLDVLYIHDVEFVPLAETLGAVAEAQRLQDEGIVRFVGVSGYPVDYLATVAATVKQRLSRPLDIVLSYCNFCIQNTLLGQWRQAFEDAGVIKLVNASPLSMSLLRSQPTHSFHPAPQVLKDRVRQAAEYTGSQGVELADVASRFVFKRWDGPTVFGLQTVDEVDSALEDYWRAKEVTGQNEAKDDASEDEIENRVRSILGDTIDLVWPSGIGHSLD